MFGNNPFIAIQVDCKGIALLYNLEIIYQCIKVMINEIEVILSSIEFISNKIIKIIVLLELLSIINSTNAICSNLSEQKGYPMLLFF